MTERDEKVEAIAAALHLAYAEHERIDHRLAVPSELPPECALDIASRILVHLERAEAEKGRIDA